MADDIIERYGKRVGYSDSELEKLHEEGRMTLLNVTESAWDTPIRNWRNCTKRGTGSDI